MYFVERSDWFLGIGGYREEGHLKGEMRARNDKPAGLSMKSCAWGGGRRTNIFLGKPSFWFLGRGGKGRVTFGLRHLFELESFAFSNRAETSRSH